MKSDRIKVFKEVFGAGVMEHRPVAAPVAAGKRKTKAKKEKDVDVAQGQITSQNLLGLSTTWDTEQKKDTVNGERVRNYLNQKPMIMMVCSKALRRKLTLHLKCESMNIRCCLLLLLKRIDGEYIIIKFFLEMLLIYWWRLIKLLGVGKKMIDILGVWISLEM